MCGEGWDRPMRAALVLALLVAGLLLSAVAPGASAQPLCPGEAGRDNLPADVANRGGQIMYFIGERESFGTWYGTWYPLGC